MATKVVNKPVKTAAKKPAKKAAAPAAKKESKPKRETHAFGTCKPMGECECQ